MGKAGGIKRKPRHRTRRAAPRIPIDLLLIGDPEWPTRSGIVCSAPWGDVAIDAIEAGKVKPHRTVGALAKALYTKKVYPPGNGKRSMIVCPECGREAPPPAIEREDRFCSGCVEDTRPGIRDEDPLTAEQLDQLEIHELLPKGALQSDVIAKISYGRRVINKDGDSVFVRAEEETPHEQARQFIRDQEDIERRLAVSESEEQLRAEWAMYDAGLWKPDFVPDIRPRVRVNGRTL
jgi:hypothetical protein